MLRGQTSKLENVERARARGGFNRISKFITATGYNGFRESLANEVSYNPRLRKNLSDRAAGEIIGRVLLLFLLSPFPPVSFSRSLSFLFEFSLILFEIELFDRISGRTLTQRRVLERTPNSRFIVDRFRN